MKDIEKISEEIGVKIEKEKKRGEMKIIFNNDLELKMSQKKALLLLLWILNKNKNNKGV